MTTQVLMFINDQHEQKVEVKAYGKDKAAAYIFAGSWDEVPALMTQAQSMATEATANWIPEEEPAEEPAQHHYQVCRTSLEEMDARARAYEGTTAGRRFLAGLDKAIQFTLKHKTGNSGLTLTQAMHLSDLYHNNMLDGMFDVFALGFRCGFKQAKKER